MVPGVLLFNHTVELPDMVKEKGPLLLEEASMVELGALGEDAIASEATALKTVVVM